MSDALKPEAHRAGALVEMIKPILAGEDPEVQGAVLADLLSIWLACHVVRGDQEATKVMRHQLLAFHLEKVLDLVPLSEAELFGEETRRPDA